MRLSRNQYWTVCQFVRRFWKKRRLSKNPCIPASMMRWKVWESPLSRLVWPLSFWAFSSRSLFFQLLQPAAPLLSFGSLCSGTMEALNPAKWLRGDRINDLGEVRDGRALKRNSQSQGLCWYCWSQTDPSLVYWQGLLHWSCRRTSLKALSGSSSRMNAFLKISQHCYPAKNLMSFLLTDTLLLIDYFSILTSKKLSYTVLLYYSCIKI